MIFVLSFTCMCLEMGPLLRREEGSVFLCKNYVYVHPFHSFKATDKLLLCVGQFWSSASRDVDDVVTTLQLNKSQTN
jgi:hypothetical protein